MGRKEEGRQTVIALLHPCWLGLAWQLWIHHKIQERSAQQVRYSTQCTCCVGVLYTLAHMLPCVLTYADEVHGKTGIRPEHVVPHSNSTRLLSPWDITHGASMPKKQLLIK